MKKLMILGAAYSQVPLIRAAKELGYKTIVTGIQGNYPGIAIADEVCYTDIRDKEGVLRAAKKYSIDGITSCGMDTGLISIGYVCDNLGLCGLTEEVARISTNKYLMKCALINAGVNTARFYKVSDTDELKYAMENLKMPLIIKAVDLGGSEGVYIARTSKEVFTAYEKTMATTKKDYCIIEEFIEGETFGAEAFVYDNKTVFILPHGRTPYMLGTEVSIGHYVPLMLSNDIIREVKSQIELAIRALGLNNCAVDADLVVKDGKVYLIKITGRVGGVFLGDLVSIYYNIDYYKMLAMMAVREDPTTIFNNRIKKYTPNVSRLFISEKDGIVEDIINNNEPHDDIYCLQLDIIKGSRVRKFTGLKDKLGHVIVKGDSVDYCMKRISEIISKIDIIVNPYS